MKILEGGHRTWPKFVIGRFFFAHGQFFGQKFLPDQKSNVFWTWMPYPPPFIFSKNYVIPKVTCGLFKVSISVFGMGTGFSISCLVISKIAFFAKKSMSKMVRNFCFQKYWLFKEEKARKFLNVLGVNCAAQCSSSYTFTYSIVFGMGIEVLLKRKHFLSWILCSYSQQNHVFFLWKSCRKHYSQKCWLFRWV